SDPAFPHRAACRDDAAYRVDQDEIGVDDEINARGRVGDHLIGIGERGVDVVGHERGGSTVGRVDIVNIGLGFKTECEGIDDKNELRIVGRHRALPPLTGRGASGKSSCSRYLSASFAGSPGANRLSPELTRDLNAYRIKDSLQPD